MKLMKHSSRPYLVLPAWQTEIKCWDGTTSLHRIFSHLIQCLNLSPRGFAVDLKRLRHRLVKFFCHFKLITTNYHCYVKMFQYHLVNNETNKITFTRKLNNITVTISTKLEYYKFPNFSSSEVSGCRLIDLCIVIDSSGSIRDNNPPDNSYDNWTLLLDFVGMVGFFLIINSILLPPHS